MSDWMKDQIIIENLEVYGYHGVFQEENQRGQHFYVNAVLETDTRLAGQTDDLTLSTHYGLVCELLHDLISNRVHKLIETVAEEAAEQILLQFPLVQAVTLEIRKPEAPIDLPFGCVSVKIKRGWHDACIAFGSNMGDSERIIKEGLLAIENNEKFRDMKVSDVIRSAPYGGVAQDDFLNGAFKVRTLYSPDELLNELREIEKKAGRERLIHWGPRTLDLDIILYDDLILESEELIIPHKDMLNRDFVIKPAAQVAPGMIHPVEGKTLRMLAEAMETKYII